MRNVLILGCEHRPVLALDDLFGLDVVALDQKPVLLLPVEPRRDERPAAVQACAVELDGQLAVSLLLEELVGARVPDLDGAAAVLALRDLPVEGGVLEGVILDVDRERPRARLERHAFRHRPRGERAVPLEAEVVVEASGVVPLDDENGHASFAPRWKASARGSWSGGAFCGTRRGSRHCSIHNEVYGSAQGKEAPEACLPDGGLGAAGPAFVRASTRL